MTYAPESLTGRRVVVVGGGIAGLTAGFRLQQLGCDVLVLERGRHAGGRMATIEHMEYRIDTAASILSTGYKQTLALIADAGLAAQVQPTSGVMGVLRDGTVHRLNGLGVSSILGTGLLGVRSKIALLGALRDLARCCKGAHWYDLSGAEAADTESAGAFARRRLTAELAEYLIDPMCHDLFLTASAEVFKLPLLFFLGALAGRSFFNSPSGVGFLTEGLARQLRVECSATVEAVEEHARGVRVHWTRPGEAAHQEGACAAVIALPAVHVPPIYRQLTDEQAAFLNVGIYARSIVVSFGLARPPPGESAMWLTVPKVAGPPDLAALILEHNKAPGRVPPGRGMVTTFWMRDWSRRRWDDDDAAIARDAVSAAGKVLSTMGDEVEMTHVRRWDPCVSVRAPGGYKMLRRFVAGLDPSSRVQLAGDYFTSLSTNGSLCSGEWAAVRVAGALQHSTARSPRQRRLRAA